MIQSLTSLGMMEAMNLSEKFIRSITSQAKPSQAYGDITKGRDIERENASKKKDKRFFLRYNKKFMLRHSSKVAFDVLI